MEKERLNHIYKHVLKQANYYNNNFFNNKYYGSFLKDDKIFIATNRCVFMRQKNIKMILY